MKTFKNCFKILLVLNFFCFAAVSYAASYKSNPSLKLLEQTSKAFTNISKKSTPGVVFIKTEMKQPGGSYTGYNDERAHPFDHFADEFFRRFFGGAIPQSQAPSPSPSPSPQLAGGSGFLVSEDGYILTNNHVIKDTSKILAVMTDGREYEATVIGTDPRTDLAVIKIQETNLPYLDFANSDNLDIGEWVVAIGSPFALEASLTVGVVSAKGRQDLGITTLEDFVQTDAAINPGNSGGPLLNLNGDVIGVNTAIATKSGGYMGIGFAIPSKLAKHVVDQIINTGVVKRAYMGVILQPIDKELAEAMKLNKSEGILVSEVLKDSPASKAGLESGDIIVSLNGKSINNVNKFRNEIAMMSPDSLIHLKVQRKDKELLLKINLGILSESDVASTELFQKMGLDIEDLCNLKPDLSSKLGYAQGVDGVIITKVSPGSPAAMAGIRPYQLITGVVIDWKNQKKVTTVDEFNTALKEIGSKKHIVLIVRHQNYQRYYTLKLP